MTNTFLTDGWVIRREGNLWCDRSGDLVFDCDKDGHPIDFRGECLDGDFLPDLSPETLAQIRSALDAGWNDPRMDDYDTEFP